MITECTEDQTCVVHSEPGNEVLSCSAEVHSPYYPSLSPHGTYADAVKAFKVFLIKGALRRTRDNIARAAKVLGATRQGLTELVERGGLRATPKKTRRRSIIQKGRNR